MEYSREYKVVSPGDSGMEEGTAHGTLQGPEDVKGKMRRVVGDLESVLGELKTVVGDLQTLVSQIDVVTTHIDRQCGSTSEEDSVKSGRRQMSESALDPPQSRSSSNIIRSVSHSANFLNMTCASPKPGDRARSTRHGSENVLKLPQSSEKKLNSHLKGSRFDPDRGYIRLGHMRTHSDGDPFFTTADLDAILSTSQCKDTDDDPMYVSTRVIKSRTKNKHKVSSSTSETCASSAWSSNDCRKGSKNVSSGDPSRSRTKTTEVSKLVGAFDKPPPVPAKEGRVAQSVSKIQSQCSRNFQPSRAFFNMDHRGNNPKFYENSPPLPRKESSFILPKGTGVIESSTKEDHTVSSSHEPSLPTPDANFEPVHTIEKRGCSMAGTYSTGFSSDLNLDSSLAMALARPLQPAPEYSGVYERQLEETLEMALAADTLEMYDSIDDTESLPLGMEAQHARHSTHSPVFFLELCDLPEKNSRDSPRRSVEHSKPASQNSRRSPHSPPYFPEEREMAAEQQRKSPRSPLEQKDRDSQHSKHSSQFFPEPSNTKASSPEASDEGLHSSIDSFQDIYDSDYDDCDNDGDDECDYEYQSQHVLQHGDLLQGVLPSALNHRNIQYSWTAVAEP